MVEDTNYKLKELRKMFSEAQILLEEFNIWFLKHKHLRMKNKPQYRQECKDFLVSKKKFLDDRGYCHKVFNSQGEMAMGLLLEILRVADFQTNVYIMSQEVDFFIPKMNLIIEVDGKHHYADFYEQNIGTEKPTWIINWDKVAETLQKTRDFESSGIRILRFYSGEIMRFHGDNKIQLNANSLTNLISSIMNFFNNEDDIGWVKFVKDNP